MNNKFWILFFLTACFLSSCRRQKIHKTTSVAAAADSAETMREFARIGEIPDTLRAGAGFTYLSARSKLTVRGKLQNIDNATVNLRMKRDSVIWLSVTALGLEVVRGVISPENVRILDKFHKVFLEASYSSLSSKLGFPVDYDLIQAVILGEIPSGDQGSAMGREKEEELTLRQSRGNVRLDSFVKIPGRKPDRLEAFDFSTGNQLRISYSDFRGLPDVLIPYVVELALKVRPKQAPDRTDESEISLTHLKAEVGEAVLSFPFNVPNNYKRAF